MAQTFTLTIRLGNAAMLSGDDIAGALRDTADKLANRYDGLTMPEIEAGTATAILDTWGNVVGHWEVSE